jgi:hypothetical protein
MMNLKEEQRADIIGVKFGRKITQEIEDAYKADYGNRGWTDTICDAYVSFIDPSGRWHDLFDRSNDRCYYVDGFWKINLVSTKNGGVVE